MPLKPISHVGGFCNAQDQRRPVEAPIVSGSYPVGLAGSLYTVGPGTYDVKFSRQGESGAETRVFSFGHWFDHLPLHGYLPKLPGGLYHTDTNQSFFAKFMGASKRKSKRPDKEICNGNILTDFTWPARETSGLVCLNHVGMVQELDPVTLDPLHITLWDEVDAAFQGTFTSPHPHFDRTTNETVSFTIDVGYRTTEYNVFSTRHNVAEGPTSALLANFVGRPSMVHSFAVTPNYVIIAAYPMGAALSGFRFVWKNSLLNTFGFSSTEPTLIYVVSRTENRLCTVYQADPFFSLHHVNAFEDDSDNIYMDLVAYPNDTILHKLDLPNLRNPQTRLQLPAPEIRRYLLASVRAESRRMNVATAKLADFPIAHFSCPAKTGVELPRINPAYHRCSYRYVYGIAHQDAQSVNPGFWDALKKVDMLREEDTLVWYEPGCYPGEPVFVARSAASLVSGDDSSSADIPMVSVGAEDEGYIISVVFDSQREQSFVLVLDAANFMEVCRVALPHVIPLSFGHGSFRSSIA
ncbi:retinal pigment epithelial membrane protein-domain-containing protein [Dimargaris cristalligena]|uniref:Retinal pigment epithelial membrane protein-domain-containing protein n=1 Tax=Dimargaris cristalligena TaxID=215637 RepID=A0A4P9ZL44_9FUNG|nr:retinal pigment epithelial membrane protein-domain-containing protein [Dimargaris cristalligena]|eukprot:RKP33798.1 retinal pigment epithelial membrane protein-domain-containing protein [Dimargaris cristalligena]